MEKLIGKLYEARENKSVDYGKDMEIGFNLVPMHPMVTKLSKKAVGLTVENSYITLEDIHQEVAMVIVQAARRFIEEGQATEDYLVEHLNVEDATMAQFWSYTETRLIGHVKNLLKRKTQEGSEDALNREYTLFSVLEVEGNIAEIDNIIYKNIVTDQRCMNPFTQWFMDNKNNILTKKQLEFLESGCQDSKHGKEQRERIAKRVLRAYGEEFSSSNLKELELQQQVDILEDILDNNLVEKLREYQNSDFVIELLINNKIKTEEYKAITAAIQGKVDELPLNIYIKLTLILDLKRAELNNILGFRQFISLIS